MEKAVPPYTRKNPANGYYGQALDGRGEPITLTISRAWKYTSVTQDIVASELSQDSTLGNDYFFLIPHADGEVVCELENAPEGEQYTIDATEVTAYKGAAMPYRIRKILSAGTTLSNFSIGY